MKNTYSVTGLTCNGCEASVKSALLENKNISEAIVSKDSSTAVITMDKMISLEDLQMALGGQTAKYQISNLPSNDKKLDVISRTWWQIYQPILLIFGYITLMTVLAQWRNSNFDWMVAMRHFMAGFFLVFSFFKMLNLKGFAESYKMYDIVAMRIPFWGYVYAFVEIGLGIAYLVDFNPYLTNWITLIVMTISIVGVLQSVLNKQKIQCACLGVVFDLPMSTVTIIEDAAMIVMSGLMLFNMQ